MMLRSVDATTKWRPEHQRAMQPATGAVTHAGGVADDLLQPGIDKAHELEFRDGPEALSGHADGGTGDQVFRQRRIHHPLEAERLFQTNRGAEHTAVGGDVFTQHHHVLVLGHCPVQGHVDRFHQGDVVGRFTILYLAHAAPLRCFSAICSRWPWSAVGRVSNR